MRSRSTMRCELKPSWNAAVCKGDFGRMTVGGADPSPGLRANFGPLGAGAAARRFRRRVPVAPAAARYAHPQWPGFPRHR